MIYNLRLEIIFILYIMYSSGVEKGVMVPPVIIDVNGDSVNDILISMFEGKLVLKNGWDLSIMWTASFPGTETYSTPAPGYFDDDDVIDFMVHLSTGTWPRYNVSNVSTGNTLYTPNSHVTSKAEASVKAFEPSLGQATILVSDQVRNKPDCTATVQARSLNF